MCSASHRMPAGKARLRVTLSATHETRDVDRLLDALAQLPRHVIA